MYVQAALRGLILPLGGSVAPRVVCGGDAGADRLIEAGRIEQERSGEALLRTGGLTERETAARAIKAEPWEPLPCMVKRQCPEYRYYLAPATDRAERKNLWAALMSRVALSMVSMRLPSRIDRPIQVAPVALDLEVGVSRPKEFHLRPLAEPDVNLSAHPAPIIHPTTDTPLTNERTHPAHCARAARAPLRPVFYGRASLLCLRMQPPDQVISSRAPHWFAAPIR